MIFKDHKQKNCGRSMTVLVMAYNLFEYYGFFVNKEQAIYQQVEKH